VKIEISDREAEIIKTYLLLSQGKKINYNFVAFHSEIDKIIETLNNESR
jgi:hypothetical protein